MKKIIGVVIIALFLPVIAQGEDGNFTGYPDGQYIWIANPELRIRDQGQIGWGDGSDTSPDATFSYNSVSNEIEVKGATFAVQSGIDITPTAVTDIAFATYTVLSTDDILGVTYTATGTVAIVIPTALNIDGATFVVKDAGFNATTYPITIDCEDAADKIENSTGGVTISGSGDSLSLFSDGDDWFIF